MIRSLGLSVSTGTFTWTGHALIFKTWALFHFLVWISISEPTVVVPLPDLETYVHARDADKWPPARVNTLPFPLTTITSFVSSWRPSCSRLSGPFHFLPSQNRTSHHQRSVEGHIIVVTPSNLNHYSFSDHQEEVLPLILFHHVSPWTVVPHPLFTLPSLLYVLLHTIRNRHFLFQSRSSDFRIVSTFATHILTSLDLIFLGHSFISATSSVDLCWHGRLGRRGLLLRTFDKTPWLLSWKRKPPPRGKGTGTSRPRMDIGFCMT